VSTLTDYAWAAGFLDGEGYIGIMKSRGWTGVRKVGSRAGKLRQDNPSFQFFVYACQNNPAPIDRLVQLFGGVKASYPHRSGEQRQVPHYRWRIASNEALAALELMLPYFVGKAAVVNHCVSFQRYWTQTKSVGRAMSPERRETARQYYEECRRLNALYRSSTQRGITEGLLLDWPGTEVPEIVALTGSGEK
jgi:hypothetical protein